MGKDEEAQEAIKILNDTIHKYKIRLKFKEGDFLSSQNNNCIHAKEVVNVVDEEKLKERWLMKTVNIYQHYKYEHHYMKDRYGIVLG